METDPNFSPRLVHWHADVELCNITLGRPASGVEEVGGLSDGGEQHRGNVVVAEFDKSAVHLGEWLVASSPREK